MGQLELSTNYAVQNLEEKRSVFGEFDVSVSIRRALAAFTDTAILSVVLLWFLNNYGLVARRFVINIPLPGPAKSLPHHWVLSGYFLSPGPMITFGAICLLYFTIFEAAFAWTPGKLLFNIRVVDFFGGRPTITQALTRNVFRIVDAYPFIIPNLTGGVILISNRRHQRGGDRAAGTLVVDRSSYLMEREIYRMRTSQPAPQAPLGEEVWT